MKYVRLTVRLGILPLLLLLLTGCQKEETLGNEDKAPGITLALTIPASETALARATTDPLTGENILSNVYVLFYPKAAPNLAAPSFFYAETNINKEEKWTYNIPTADLKSRLTEGTAYDVYIVASLPTATTAPTSTTTKGELLALVETQFERSAAPLMSFSGKGVVTYIPNTNSRVDIELCRTVARLDITFEGLKTGQTAELQLKQASATPYFKGESLTTFEILNSTLTADASNIFRAYVYENYPAYATSEKTQFILIVKSNDGSTPVIYEPIVINKGTIDRNNIYQIHGKLVDGTIIITTNKLPWGEVVQGEEKPTPIQPKANSYLVFPGSEAILIPVAQANDAAVPGIVNGEVLTAEMVWTDVKGITSGKGLAPDAAVAAIEVIGSGPDAVLKVTPGSQLGNAVIAVKNAGVVKWSWHIWVTEYDLKQETGQNTSGGYIFMDRNLGAKSILPDINGVDIIGNYYQFGRKDPFPTKSSALGFVPVYNADGTVIAAQAAEVPTTSAENQIRNPYLWGNATGYPTGLDLWGASGNKTANDPCPSGWRVPPSDAYIDLSNILLPNDATTMGRKGAHTGYYPYTWFKDPNRTFRDMKLVVNWTSTPDGTANGRFLRAEVGTSVIVNYTFTRAIGHAVRCVRDWNKGKAEKEIRVLSAGHATPSAAHQLGLAPPYGRTYVGGLNALMTNNFGQGNPVDVFFKHYNYSKNGANAVGTDYTFIDQLAVNDIDVIYLPWNGSASPTVAQADDIITWLDADPHRVLVINIDYNTTCIHLVSKFGFTHFNQVSEVCVLAGGNSDIYNAMNNGKYGKLAGTDFNNVDGAGYMMKDDIEKNGFVPILTHKTNANKVTLAVNPTRRVILIGDISWFDNGNGLGVDGSIGYKAKGEYSLLFANMWAWIAETVKAK